MNWKPQTFVWTSQSRNIQLNSYHGFNSVQRHDLSGIISVELLISQGLHWKYHLYKISINSCIIAASLVTNYIYFVCLMALPGALAICLKRCICSKWNSIYPRKCFNTIHVQIAKVQSSKVQSSKVQSFKVQSSKSQISKMATCFWFDFDLSWWFCTVMIFQLLSCRTSFQLRGRNSRKWFHCNMLESNLCDLFNSKLGLFN